MIRRFELSGETRLARGAAMAILALLLALAACSRAEPSPAPTSAGGPTPEFTDVSLLTARPDLRR